KPELADVYVTDTAHVLSLGAQTVDGRYRIVPAPVGSFEASAGLTQVIGGGSSQRVTATLAIAPGQVVTQDFDLESGVTIVLLPTIPEGVATETVEGMLFPGAEVP